MDLALLAASSLVSSSVGALVGALVAALRGFRDKDREEREAFRKKQVQIEIGVRSLLRGEIVAMHHAATRRGYCTTVDREVMERNFEAYTGLGGNGVAQALYHEFAELPTREEAR